MGMRPIIANSTPINSKIIRSSNPIIDHPIQSSIIQTNHRSINPVIAGTDRDDGFILFCCNSVYRIIFGISFNELSSMYALLLIRCKPKAALEDFNTSRMSLQCKNLYGRTKQNHSYGQIKHLSLTMHASVQYAINNSAKPLDVMRSIIRGIPPSLAIYMLQAYIYIHIYI